MSGRQNKTEKKKEKEEERMKEKRLNNLGDLPKAYGERHRPTCIVVTPDVLPEGVFEETSKWMEIDTQLDQKSCPPISGTSSPEFKR